MGKFVKNWGLLWVIENARCLILILAELCLTVKLINFAHVKMNCGCLNVTMVYTRCEFEIKFIMKILKYAHVNRNVLVAVPVRNMIVTCHERKC